MDNRIRVHSLKKSLFFYLSNKPKTLSLYRIGYSTTFNIRLRLYSVGTLFTFL